MSISTDAGIELNTLLMTDTLSAFLHWMGGEELSQCARYIKVNARLMPFAIRISGWSHGMASVIENITNRWEGWPDCLAKRRALCTLYRNTTWRRHVSRAVAVGHPDVDIACLKSYTANFAKWRYETVPTVFGALRPLRHISEHCLVRSWFVNPQDRETIQKTFEAAADPFYWKYVEYSEKEIYARIEKCRHWGMICTCPHHVQAGREGAKHIRCPYNGRRLRDAWSTIEREMATALARADALLPEDVEGDVRLCALLKSQLRQKAGVLKQRFTYLKLPPWSFSRADTAAGATTVLGQVRSRPIENHDKVTQRLFATFEHKLDVLALGGECEPELAEAVRRINLSALDESAGEWYHGSITHERRRAASNSTMHLKQGTRQEAVLKRVQAFRTRYGARGMEVIRFEWRNYKRLLQMKPAMRWWSVKLARGAFFHKCIVKMRERNRTGMQW